jgi:hypothetical protein
VIERGEPLSRRTFLRRAAWLAAAGAAATLAAGIGGGAIPLVPETAPATRLTTVLGSAGAARIGRSALAAGVVPGGPQALLAALGGRVPDLDLILRDGTDDDVRVALDVARRRDFAGGRDGTVRLGGWVVARTEALACALIAVA